MLLKKKKFAVSCAVVATMFVGCQTAQKSSGPVSDADLFIPDAYVSNDGAYRGLAGTPGDLWEKATARLAKFGDRGEAEIQKILKALNENKAGDAEIAAFKKKYGKITKENAGQLDNEIHARVLDELISKSKNFKALMEGSTESAKQLRDAHRRLHPPRRPRRLPRRHRHRLRVAHPVLRGRVGTSKARIEGLGAPRT